MTDFDTRIRQNSKVLETISKCYPKNSPEREALRISAFAFGYVILHQQEEFDEYVKTMHKPLTKVELARLRKLRMKRDPDLAK